MGIMNSQFSLCLLPFITILPFKYGNAQPMKEIAVLKGHKDQVWSIAFAPIVKCWLLLMMKER